jgi:hypothetical protein
MHRTVILQSLSKSNVNVFDEVVAAIEYEFNKPAVTIQEMKERVNKKTKGDIWEAFCKDWLLATGNYQNVWLLEEYNQIFTNNLSRQDNGIDIIAKTNTGWQAIQCKYRNKGKVTWKSLSTFIALCERTGPPTNTEGHISWEKYVVMTNSTGITHKLPKTSKDKSICQKTFQNTTRDHWLRMIGKDHGNKLVPDPIPQLPSTITDIVKPLQLLVIRPNTSQPKDLDELRQKRLARFEPNK